MYVLMGRFYFVSAHSNVDVGIIIGSIPNQYDHFWFLEKIAYTNILSRADGRCDRYSFS